MRALCESFGNGPALLLPRRAARATPATRPGSPSRSPRWRRANGLQIDVVSDLEHLYCSRIRTRRSSSNPVGARLLDGRTLGVDLLWRCAHETAATILDRIAERAERTGDLALATAARALTLTLPLEDDSREFRMREHRRLLARLELGRRGSRRGRSGRGRSRAAAPSHSR